MSIHFDCFYFTVVNDASNDELNDVSVIVGAIEDDSVFFSSFDGIFCLLLPLSNLTSIPSLPSSKILPLLLLLLIDSYFTLLGFRLCFFLCVVLL